MVRAGSAMISRNLQIRHYAGNGEFHAALCGDGPAITFRRKDVRRSRDDVTLGTSRCDLSL